MTVEQMLTRAAVAMATAGLTSPWPTPDTDYDMADALAAEGFLADGVSVADAAQALAAEHLRTRDDKDWPFEVAAALADAGVLASIPETTAVTDEYMERLVAMWDGLGAEQEPKCAAVYPGGPDLGPVECVLFADHVNDPRDDRHAAGPEEGDLRWSDADAVLARQMLRASSAPAGRCVVCQVPCAPGAKGCCRECAGAETGPHNDDATTFTNETYQGDAA